MTIRKICDQDKPYNIPPVLHQSLTSGLSTTRNCNVAAGKIFSVNEVIKSVRLFVTDDGRTSALQILQDKQEVVSASEALTMVGLFVTDDGRTSALQILQDKLGVVSASKAITLVGLFKTDDGRTSTLQILQDKLEVASASEAITLVGLFKTDDGRNYAQNIVGSLFCTVDQINSPLHSSTTPHTSAFLPRRRNNVSRAVFSNHSNGGDSVQFEVSLTRNTRQVKGHVTDEMLQEISRFFAN
ncbi:hypothetical protein KXW44_006462 [Aspergillus fumigatus]|nr:hypothetical protein KXW44_006462 [Aspergillus fumigatus]